MADSQDGRGQDEAVAAFESRIEELRREGVSSYPPLGGKTPWAETTETRKLEEIVWESWTVSHGSTVLGVAALAAIEREVDYAGLPTVQREMLEDLRARLDAGQFGGEQPEHKDLAGRALARIVGIGQFEQGLGEWKENEDRPWAEVPEAVKVRVIVDVAQEAGPPGAYTLRAIEREVDYDRLPPWRREALEGLRARLDRGELDGESPDPSYQGDRAELALRLAELDARVEEDKRIGLVESRDRRIPWQALGEGEKFDLIMGDIRELHLESESGAYGVLVREVDMTRAPEERRREFEGSRSENAMGSPDRDALLRETYRLNHELGYIGFRHQYFNDPDAIKEWPDPALRERELRNFWDNEGGGDFASYYKSHANESVKALTAYRNDLRGLLAGGKDDQIAYYHRISDLGRNGRLHDEGFGEVEAVSKPLPSAGAIADDADDGDGMPTPEEWRKLKAEWTTDYGLRHLEDRGVKYEDEGERPLDHAAAGGKGERQGGEQGERLPLPGELAESRDDVGRITDEQIHRALADRHEIAITWSTVDVQHVRPNLDEEQAWEVLQQVKDIHDAQWGLSWATLATVADDLFPKHRENRTPSPGELAEDRGGPESPGPERGRERGR